MSKIVSFAIPCYNSAGYMDHCVQSILDGADGAEDIEIIIVDDGSQKDETPEKADAWARKLPGIVKAVHQENGGHGTAVLTGLANAEGTFFKVVDSDDWVDADALRALLDKMRETEVACAGVDLFITNYVYEHTADGTQNVVSYSRVLPQNRVFGWNVIGHTGRRCCATEACPCPHTRSTWTTSTRGYRCHAASGCTIWTWTCTAISSDARTSP